MKSLRNAWPYLATLGVFLFYSSALIAASGIAGCDGPSPYYQQYQQAPQYAQPPMVANAPMQPQVTQQSFLMHAEAFNLGQVVSLLKTSQVTDATSLERTVNDPSTAINNVDIDNGGAGDGNIDYVGVQEQQTPNGRRFEFVAYPSSQQGQSNPTPVTIATVNLTVVNNMVSVQAGYPQYVNGYNTAYYNDSYRLARDMLFYSWLLSPRPIYIPRPYYGSYWAPRHVFAPSYVTSARTSYETRTHVSPIRTVTPPPSYTGAVASRVPTGLAQRPAATSARISDRAGQMRDFKVNDPNKSVGYAANLRAPSVNPTPTPTPPAAPSYSAPKPPAAAPVAYRPSSPPPASAPMVRPTPAPTPPAYRPPPSPAPSFWSRPAPSSPAPSFRASPSSPAPSYRSSSPPSSGFRRR